MQRWLWERLAHLEAPPVHVGRGEVAPTPELQLTPQVELGLWCEAVWVQFPS